MAEVLSISEPRAYPRSRGATAWAAARAWSASGLSPLARGNPGLPINADCGPGPIPARAGQPAIAAVFSRCCRAYPRSRGATFRATSEADNKDGLSPLARGNLHHRGAARPRGGPIPARAGQPRAVPRGNHPVSAYPRSRGATRTMTEYLTPAEGLSPLARGNQVLPSKLQGFGGPIPARAGQPLLWHPAQSWTRAYPRSRGATRLEAHVHQLVQGLSPLARGNLHHFTCGDAGKGPIPARAGQPLSARLGLPAYWAYPRSRGATSTSGNHGLSRQGLSPLARGNPQPQARRQRAPGPIPARAGQPQIATSTGGIAGAYPRSRGATGKAMGAIGNALGLSPLARGNRRL